MAQSSSYKAVKDMAVSIIEDKSIPDELLNMTALDICKKMYHN